MSKNRTAKKPKPNASAWDEGFVFEGSGPEEDAARLLLSSKTVGEAAHAMMFLALNSKVEALADTPHRISPGKIANFIAAALSRRPEILSDTLVLCSGRPDAAPFASTLLSLGADPNSRDLSGRTPLHMAAREGCVDTVRALLEHGANPEAKSFGRQTPMKATFDVGPGSAAILETRHGEIRTMLEEASIMWGARKKNEMVKISSPGSL